MKNTTDTQHIYIAHIQHEIHTTKKYIMRWKVWERVERNFSVTHIKVKEAPPKSERHHPLSGICIY